MPIRRIVLIGLLAISLKVFATPYQIGQNVEVQWRGYWYPGVIIGKNSHQQWHVRLPQFSEEWDQWVGNDRLRLPSAQQEVVSTPAKTSQPNFAVGDIIKVQWRNQWYRAKIIDKKANEWKVHYLGFSRHHDEWIKINRILVTPSQKIAEPSITHPQPLQLAIGQTVLAKWHNQWYLASIKAIDQQRFRVHYVGYESYWDEWLEAKHIQPLVSDTTTPADEIQQAEYSALFRATKNNQAQLVKELLAQGISVNSENKQGETALFVAVKYQLPEMVNLLLAHQADINHLDKHGQSVLLWAAQHHDWNLVRELLEQGASPNRARGTLFYLIQRNKTDLVKLMIEKGVDVNREIIPGLTALQLAQNFHHDEIIRLLYSVGAKN
ncbi:MAG: ankyrin repeat domain-containing protein [Legionellales bacterium]|nr:ankyrin repeat domain-containing protein [Legionellales bacterium]